MHWHTECVVRMMFRSWSLAVQILVRERLEARCEELKFQTGNRSITLATMRKHELVETAVTELLWSKNRAERETVRRGNSATTNGAKFLCRNKHCKKRHENFGIVPCVKTTSLKKVVFMVTNADFDMLRLKKCSARSQRKVVRKDQLHGYVSQDSYPRKSILRERGKLGSNHTVKISKGTWHQKKGSIARDDPKV